MNYPQRLAGLPPERSLIAPADFRIAILTGQSSFASSRLSLPQEQFIEAIAPDGYDLLMSGFPYHADQMAVRPEPSIIAASWRNAAQTLWSVRPTGFRNSLSQIVGMLISRTNRRLVVIAGSCGLQLINSIWPGLPKHPQLDIRVIALGPACFGPLQMSASVIQGSQDLWSKLFYRGPVHFHVRCGHLDYWDSPEVRQITNSLIVG